MKPLIKRKTKEEKLKHKLAKAEAKAKKKRYKKMNVRKDQEAFLEKKSEGFNKDFVFGQSKLRDVGTEHSLVDATIVLIPKIDSYWKVASLFAKKKKMKMNLKGDLSDKKLDQLKDTAQKTPGSTKMEIQRLLNLHPRSRDLYMLSAICTNKMLQNTRGENKDIVDGLKLGVIDAATAVVSDGLSLYNLQHFFEIYFRYLEKLKRHQQSVYEMVNNDGPYANLRMNLSYAMQINDLLFEKKEGCANMLAFISKSFNKSSQMHTRFDLLSIKRAVEYIKAGLPTKKMEHGTADEMVNMTMGILQTLVKVPILEPFVDQAIKYLGSTTPAMRLKIVGVHSSRLLFEFRLAVILREVETMKKLGYRVFKLNLAMIKSVKKRSIRHQSEFAPYQNLINAIEFSAAVMNKSTLIEMCEIAIKWLSNVGGLDTSKEYKYVKIAEEAILRIDALIHSDIGAGAGSASSGGYEEEEEEAVDDMPIQLKS
ncbi:MAG: hypothetical protein QNL04_09950 [SAR324 cluster bacterium]|nr:hypothetical protein [SAR324 cluster bacterium]